MEIEPQYLVIEANADASETIKLNNIDINRSVHIIPASIKPNTGNQHYDAHVSEYFQPTIRTDPDDPKANSEDKVQNLETSLLGHKLKGKVRADISNLYECVMDKDQSNVSICLLRKIENPVEWRKDQHWGSDQGRLNNIRKYCEMQEILHRN